VIKQEKKRIRVPRPVVLFFVKAISVFVIWKTAYLLFLSPKKILDRPLTESVGYATTQLLNLITIGSPYSTKLVDQKDEAEGSVTWSKAVDIYSFDQPTLRIADACNSLELLVLYTGFILCFPSSWLRKMVFISGGITLIYILNILRCAALILIYIYYNQFLDFSHHFVFTFLVYTFIFLLWFIFTKNLRLNAGRS
jgi:exosortase family protein XrtF